MRFRQKYDNIRPIGFKTTEEVMEINTNILNEMGLIQKFGDFLSQGQGTSLEEFFDSPAGKDYKSAYEQKLQTLGDTKATTENGLPQTEQQNKDEIKIEYGSSKSSADILSLLFLIYSANV